MLDAFYATCVHEIIHSTSHQSCLNREVGQGEEEYAQEKLRAEITSMRISHGWGLKFDDCYYEKHSAYLQSWTKALRGDSNELYRAATRAQEMADYVGHNMLLKGLEQPKSLREGKEKNQ